MSKDAQSAIELEKDSMKVKGKRGLTSIRPCVDEGIFIMYSSALYLSGAPL